MKTQLQSTKKARASQQDALMGGAILQLKCDECTRKPLLQRSARQPGCSQAPPVVHDVLRSPGKPLDPATRALMEPRFGHDFSRVRVHTDAQAAESARAVNALAYTVGENIVFEAEHYAPTTLRGRLLLAHELAHVTQQASSSGAGLPHTLQRKCKDKLGAPTPDCPPDKREAVAITGVKFMFMPDCDDLDPGAEAAVNFLKPGRRLNIHGFAGPKDSPRFKDSLPCHRANAVKKLVEVQRPECPVLSTFKHGDKAPVAPGPEVIIEEIRPTPEEWLDPTSVLKRGKLLYEQAKKSPTKPNMDSAGAYRDQIKKWLEDIPKTIAPPKAELDQKDLDDYRQFYASAEALWTEIDGLLIGRATVPGGTHADWAKPPGKAYSSGTHATGVPKGARYHIDIFGEGFYPGAINLNMLYQSSTTGVSGTRIPNLIHREFSASYASKNRLPFADHIADLVTSESGPINDPGLVEEIARVIVPGGTIIFYGGSGLDQACTNMQKLVAGSMNKTKDQCSIIAEPGF